MTSVRNGCYDRLRRSHIRAGEPLAELSAEEETTRRDARDTVALAMALLPGKQRGLSKLLAGIRSIRILVADKPDETFCGEARRVAETGAYQLMSSLSEGEQYTCFYLYDGGRWGESEFLMLTFGHRENVVVEIVGVFDVRAVSRLSTLWP